VPSPRLCPKLDAVIGEIVTSQHPEPFGGSDFVLRSAGCQGKHLIAEGCRGATTVTWFRGRSKPAAALPLRWSNCLGR
jgi:hypothetical protein